jgi:hypothetical protein
MSSYSTSFPFSHSRGHFYTPLLSDRTSRNAEGTEIDCNPREDGIFKTDVEPVAPHPVDSGLERYESQRLPISKRLQP